MFQSSRVSPQKYLLIHYIDISWTILHQKKKNKKHLIGLFWFYGISNIIGYLIPNPVFTYIFISTSISNNSI